MLYVGIFFKKLNYPIKIDTEKNRTWDIEVGTGQATRQGPTV